MDKGLKSERISEIINRLEKEYKNTKIALKFNNNFELLVATILSAQMTDSLVNKVTPMLFGKYGSPADFAKADPEQLMNSLKTVNFYRTKAKNIMRMSAMLLDEYGGRVPNKMKDLVKLPGVARKTANVVLSQGFGKSEGFVVDTHVKRLSQRLGFTENTNAEKIELDLMKIIPQDKWGSFSYRLILHGRKVCKARNPDCEHCILRRLCPTFKK